MPYLFISVRFHDGRYHGSGDWPPSPGRLFQALVAGVAQGEALADEDKNALEWLENLRNAPLIATPITRVGQSFSNYVPNNDRDTVESRNFKSYKDYVSALGKIRTAKRIRPILFDVERALIYAWTFEDTREDRMNGLRVSTIAEQLYQLGRGVDMAWAWGEILDHGEAEGRLTAMGGALHRPSGHASGKTLAVPLKGSLESLIERHKGMRARFQTSCEPLKKEPDRKVPADQIFVQPPKPRFRQIAYDCPPERLLFDLVGPLTPWRLGRVVELTEHVRDSVAQKLKDKLPREAAKIQDAIVGCRDANEADKAMRVRITPLPSIGHQHADQAIRRILVEIPPNCPLRADDLEWAFSGLPLIVSDDGILCELVSASERGMLVHYGVDDAAPERVWRTVTAAALPQQAARRRIDPIRLAEEAGNGTQRVEAKGGMERANKESRAAAAVVQALRHAGVSTRPASVRVQREPFEAKGARAEAFAPGTRFAKERLWHVEVAFEAPQRGPLVIGDGRFVGLGLMRPVREPPPGLHLFAIDPAETVPVHQATVLVQAFRRAVMARAQAVVGGRKSLPIFFTGHSDDGDPARSGRHEHLFFLAEDTDGDGRIDRLAVVAPHLADRRMHADRDNLQLLDKTVSGLTILRAGRAGAPRLKLIPLADEVDPVFGSARVWVSRTPYRPTRHPRRGSDVEAALRLDILTECNRRGLSVPEVDILEQNVGVKGGLTARARLHFSTIVEGPILLGVGSHFGSGLFVAQPG